MAAATFQPKNMCKIFISIILGNTYLLGMTRQNNFLFQKGELTHNKFMRFSKKFFKKDN